MELEAVKTTVMRYLDNAQEILKTKAGKKDGQYADIKYVQMASGTAYNGVLLAIDGYLANKEGLKFVKPKSIEDYRARLAKQNKKLLALLNEAYDELHLAGYYHGTPSVRTISNGLNAANEILTYL
ncbi:MAG: DUF5618 family protein [Spirosomataceae bacterium]